LNRLSKVRFEINRENRTMKTAEEILQKHFALTTVIQPSLKLVLLAMEEYANQFKPNNESIECRRVKFLNRVADFKGEYDRQILVDFSNYWLEKNENGRRFRFEKEKVFDVKKRLARWGRNQKPSGKAKAGIEEMLSLNELAKNGVSDTE